MNKVINIYERICELLKNVFIDKYFDYDDGYWIGGEIGGVYGVGDYFLSVDSMRDYIKYGYTVEQFNDYYWYAIDEYSKNSTPVNIKNWIAKWKN